DRRPARVLPGSRLPDRLAPRPRRPGPPRLPHHGRQGRGSGAGHDMTDFTEDQIHRYARHIILPDIGGAGQRKLLDASVLIVGAGGLGSPAALYLAAAGVGRIGLADHDEVDLTNLQRQILHATSDVGRPKTASGAETIEAMNP